MQPQTKSSPLVMLILRPYIIDTRRPKMPPAESAMTTVSDLIRFHCMEQLRDCSTKPIWEKVLYSCKLTYRVARTSCSNWSDFRIPSIPTQRMALSNFIYLIINRFWSMLLLSSRKHTPLFSQPLDSDDTMKWKTSKTLDMYIRVWKFDIPQSIFHSVIVILE